MYSSLIIPFHFFLEYKVAEIWYEDTDVFPNKQVRKEKCNDVKYEIAVNVDEAEFISTF
jgi:hypothetical protein